MTSSRITLSNCKLCLKVVVIPGSVNAVVNPSATRYKFEPSAPVGRVIVVVISITHALSVALFITWVPQ